MQSCALPLYILKNIREQLKWEYGNPKLIPRKKLESIWFKHSCCPSCSEDKDIGYGDDVAETCCCDFYRDVETEAKERVKQKP